MLENTCPNYDSCKLVKTSLPGLSEEDKQKYLAAYCHASSREWENCKRFICKNEIHFCPDFVLPDTELTTDQIIDQFDID